MKTTMENVHADLSSGGGGGEVKHFSHTRVNLLQM